MFKYTGETADNETQVQHIRVRREITQMEKLTRTGQGGIKRTRQKKNRKCNEQTLNNLMLVTIEKSYIFFGINATLK